MMITGVISHLAKAYGYFFQHGGKRCLKAMILGDRKYKWMVSCGKSWKMKVYAPMNFPKAIGFFKTVTVLSIQKESSTVARSMFSLMKAS